MNNNASNKKSAKLLALALSLVMMLSAVVPMALPTAAVSVGETVEEAVITDAITVDGNGYVTNITWEPGYIGSSTNAYAGPWAIASSSWSASYRRTKVFTVPKAGTTLTWSESTVKGAQSNGALVVSSWTLQADGTYVIDTAGTNIAGGGKSSANNFYYDSSAQTMTYIYTTTKDNEHLRLGIYGGTANNTWTANSSQCSRVQVKSFTDNISTSDGNISNITWVASFTATRNHSNVKSGTWAEGYVNATSWSTAYRQTEIFTVPKAGTTLTWTETSGKGAQSNAAYVISSWTPAANGGYRFDAAGANIAGVSTASSDHILYDSTAKTLTYTYTTAHDNEHLRLGIYGGVVTGEDTYGVVANSAACPTVSAKSGNVLSVHWNQGYVGSTSNVSAGQAWNVVENGSWSNAYRYTDVVKVPKAGTTLVWQEYASSSSDASSYNAFVLSTWKKDTSGNWVPDYTGTAILGDGVSIVGAQYYDSNRKTVTYTYTTTKDNELLRFGCYGRLTDALTTSSAQCPVIRAYTPTFSNGTVKDVAWFDGYVGLVQDVKSSGSDSSAHSFTYFKKSGGNYVYSAPILIPAAGTTVSFTDDSADYCSTSAYAISVWEPAKDGELNLIYGLKGGSSGPHISVSGSSRTYHYTSSHAGEIIRLCYRSDGVLAADDMTTISYVLNDSSHNGTLATAGYRDGYNGANYVTNVNFTTGSYYNTSGALTTGASYAYSASFKVFGIGTVVSFTDPSGFAGAGVYAFSVESTTSGVAANKAFSGNSGYIDNADGSRTYCYTTTTEETILRISLATSGNTDVGGAFIAPLIRVVSSADGNYEALQGKTIYAIGDSYFAGNSIDRTSVWMNRMAREYDMKLVNYGISGSTVTAKGTMDGYANGSNPMVKRYVNMPNDDSAALVIFEGGRNDYNAGANFGTLGESNPDTFYGALKIVIDGLLAKYPNALLICVTPWDLPGYGSVHNEGRHEDYAAAFVRLYEELYSSNSRVKMIPTYDDSQFPVYMINSDFRSTYCMHPTDISHLNAYGHLYALPYFEEAISNLYTNYINSIAATNVVFKNGNTTVLTQPTGVSGTLTMPSVSGTHFAGWAATVNGAPVLLPAGVSFHYREGDVILFKALFLDMATSKSAQVRLTTGSTGLRFLTTVSDLNQWEELETYASALQIGTLIVPRVYVKAIGGKLTHAALDEYSKQRLDVTTTGWYTTSGNSAQFAGSVVNILTQNYTLAFTAGGYVRITYTNGDVGYVYADNGGKFGRTVFDLATKAYNDTSEEQDNIHIYERESDGLFVSYSEAQGAVLQGFMNAPLVRLVSDGSTSSGMSLASGQSFTATTVAATASDLISEDGELTEDAQINASLFNTYLAATGEYEASGFLVVTLGGVDAKGAVLDGRAYTTHCVQYDGKLLIPYFLYSPSY